MTVRYEADQFASLTSLSLHIRAVTAHIKITCCSCQRTLEYQC